VSPKGHSLVLVALLQPLLFPPLVFFLFLSIISRDKLSKMTNPQTIIADAFEKLKRSISEEDAHKFKSTELKDVWTAVREIDSKQRKRLSAQNLRRIEPLLRGIEKYTKVIEVLCNGTPYLPYVWVRTHLVNSMCDIAYDI
jgi:hypothetical protein